MLTEAQRIMRLTGIGASEIADIVLGNGVKTYFAKTEPQPELKPTTLQGRLPMIWGGRLERPICRAYAEDTGAVLWSEIEPAGPLETMRSREYPLALATLDDIALFPDAEVVVEAKAPGEFVADEWSNGSLPEGYYIQGQWQMGVSKLGRCDVAALIAGQTFTIRRLVPNQADFEGLLEIAHWFWREYVVPRRHPPVDGSEQWDEYISRRWPRHREPLRPWTGEAQDIYDRCTALKRRIDALTAERDGERNKLRVLCGDAEGIERICTFRTNKKGSRVLRLAGED